VECPVFLGAKRRDENSEEAELRRKQRAKKRKQQMQKQVEETKVDIIIIIGLTTVFPFVHFPPYFFLSYPV